MDVNVLLPSLKSFKTLKAFNDDILAEIALLLIVRTVQPGEVMVREGDPSESFHMVEQGSLVRLRNSELLDEVVSGQIAGLHHIFRKDLCFATLAGGESGARVFSMKSSSLFTLVRSHPDFALGLMAEMAEENYELRKFACASAHMAVPGSSGSKSLRVRFFQSKAYDRVAFSTILSVFNAERAQRGMQTLYFEWVEEKLTVQSALACEGALAVCAFVSDDLSAPVLEVLSRMGVGLVAMRCAGYDNVDLSRARAYGINVVRVPRYSPQAVAEHTLALLLALVRKIHVAWARTRSNNFSLEGLVGFDLGGDCPKTVGIFGTGRVGEAFARAVHGLGCKVVLCDTFENKALARELGSEYTSLQELLSVSDVISLHAPLTNETRYVIRKETISLMKFGAVLLNTSRGALVETSSLIEALKSGQIGAAGLDVYEGETKLGFFTDHSNDTIADDAFSVLTSFRQVIVTSHQAFLTNEALESIARCTVENIRQFMDGEITVNTVK